jgi:hypothetical protein
MLTKVMTWLSVAALVLAVFSQSSLRNLGITGSVICAGAIVVLVRAVRLREHNWTAGLIIMAVLFNPVIPLPTSPTMTLGLELACILTFLTSLLVLRTQPLLSIPSITDRTPGSESL